MTKSIELRSQIAKFKSLLCCESSPGDLGPKAVGSRGALQAVLPTDFGLPATDF